MIISVRDDLFLTKLYTPHTKNLSSDNSDINKNCKHINNLNKNPSR